MTALQDWLSFRPEDQYAIRNMVCRPLRAVLSTTDTRATETPEPAAPKLLSPGPRTLLTR